MCFFELYYKKNPVVRIRHIHIMVTRMAQALAKDHRGKSEAGDVF